jgi:hypothetical protein
VGDARLSTADQNAERWIQKLETAGCVPVNSADLCWKDSLSNFRESDRWSIPDLRDA